MRFWQRNFSASLTQTSHRVILLGRSVLAWLPIVIELQLGASKVQLVVLILNAKVDDSTKVTYDMALQLLLYKKANWAAQPDSIKIQELSLHKYLVIKITSTNLINLNYRPVLF